MAAKNRKEKIDETTTEFRARNKSLNCSDVESLIKDAEKLQKLDLSQNNNLLNLPKDITKLKQLTELNISGCGFKEFPECLFELINLNKLNSSNNEISLIQNTIYELKNLEKLKLNNNKLTAFSVQLQKIQELDLSNNDLTIFPENIHNWLELSSLILSYNQIKDIPNITMATNLKVLTLDHNRIKEFDFKNISTKLETLSLQNNEIVHVVAQNIDKTYNLTFLDLHENQLEKIPNIFHFFPQLENLLLSQNKLMDLPPSIGYLESLTKLELQENNIEILPVSFCYLEINEEKEINTVKYLNFSDFKIEKNREIHCGILLPNLHDPFKDIWQNGGKGIKNHLHYLETEVKQMTKYFVFLGNKCEGKVFKNNFTQLN